MLAELPEPVRGLIGYFLTHSGSSARDLSSSHESGQWPIESPCPTKVAPSLAPLLALARTCSALAQQVGAGEWTRHIDFFQINNKRSDTHELVPDNDKRIFSLLAGTPRWRVYGAGPVPAQPVVQVAVPLWSPPLSIRHEWKNIHTLSIIAHQIQPDIWTKISFLRVLELHGTLLERAPQQRDLPLLQALWLIECPLSQDVGSGTAGSSALVLPRCSIQNVSGALAHRPLAHVNLSFARVPAPRMRQLLAGWSKSIRVLELDHCPSLDDTVCESLGRAELLEVLSVRGCERVRGHFLLAPCVACTRLTHIRADASGLLSLDIPTEEMHVSVFRGLQYLSLQRPRMAPNPILLQLVLCAAADTLCCLKIEECPVYLPFQTPGGVAWSCLVEANLANTPCSNPDAVALITQCSALRHLSVAGCSTVSREALQGALAERGRVGFPPLQSLVEPDGLMCHSGAQKRRLVG